MNLATTAALWPTPQTDSFRSRGGERKDEKGLDGMARDWPTPMANDGCKPSAGNRRTADLTHVSRLWMTPTARDHKDGATTLANTPVNGLLGRQVLATPMAGSDTSQQRKTLNPLFVEALMGWPDPRGPASPLRQRPSQVYSNPWHYPARSPWLQRMRCELWQELRRNATQNPVIVTPGEHARRGGPRRGQANVTQACVTPRDGRAMPCAGPVRGMPGCSLPP